MQQNTELLVVTLAQTLPGKEVDALARIQAIAETLRSAPGLVTSRIYTGDGNENTFLILTTWEDAESWHKAQERHSPKQLLLKLKDILTAPPEQCLMSYLWGYSRPTQSSVLASAHLITLPTIQAELTQNSWLQGLQQTSLQLLLTFAFIARGQREIQTGLRVAKPGLPGNAQQMTRLTNSILLGFFSWASEAERDEFYIEPQYQKMQTLVEGIDHTRILPLKSFSHHR